MLKVSELLVPKISLIHWDEGINKPFNQKDIFWKGKLVKRQIPLTMIHAELQGGSQNLVRVSAQHKHKLVR